ncbi:hypothetical protein H112_08293 [Trichophyton rubrum D6]|uniref:Peptidase S26 domain-containing protein n=3 Tax=Trichophyton TaxID=5550 RepID=F2SDK0_TRIRC|nr:uncharacterized protein TERG_00858 [Trichophyton rubrum CBS 118892]EZF10472.1 hypothetical protein H100_08316 [Trichophyton rubrum MR850]EZF37324.1 hypothetical protein H102_08275 [Trichophyton rubrum CBS 100081]EZF47948.1 hypothetical protein H103_08298 [Trichophyton rubrum CBS 288.86]EZF58571.1 hypothetical protein H104_08249 [Trichophyton rubrum CBS 289.86]EZF69149.1 hypothetical protein H105_08303 [Trichophyton soudanense CBS 452.61]EZF79951.1 hypothetical protein H110_08297 [Trichophy
MLSLLNGFFIPLASRLPRLILKKPNLGIIHRLSQPNAAPSRSKSHISKLNSVHKRCLTAASSSNDPRNQYDGNNNANNTDGPRGRSRYSFGRNAALDTFLFTIQGLALFIVIREHVLDIKWISGASMSPYLNKGYNIDNIDSEMVLVDVTYATKLHLERGMVVVFPSLRGSSSRTEPSKLSVKRIIALPGDIVTTRPPKSGEGGQKTQIVPWNHVWVEGDATDPDLSFDSNTYGPISMGLIKGQVMCVLRPKWRTLKWWEWENENDPVESGGDYGKSQRIRVRKDAVTVYDPNIN